MPTTAKKQGRWDSWLTQVDRRRGKTNNQAKEYVKHLKDQPKLIDLVADRINHREKEQVQYDEVRSA